MSGLTKKIIHTDKALSFILGVNEGSLVSYSDLSKGIHKYIKEKDLKNPHPVQAETQPTTTTTPLTEPSRAEQAHEAAVCKDCGEAIPAGAVYCDMCGVKQ
jgi:hypothetical protein